MDYSVTNRLIVNDFLLDSNKLEYCSHLVYYILSNILYNYFL